MMYFFSKISDVIDYFQAKGKSFDYIFGDLTDTPITTRKPSEDEWIFLSTILELGMSVLKPLTGKYLTHCNGVNVPQSITAYENVLAKICEGKVFYSKTKCYVKSFFETWVFYQLSRRDWLLIETEILNDYLKDEKGRGKIKKIYNIIWNDGIII